MLLTYHEFVALREKVAEERAWFKQSTQNCESHGINLDKIKQDNVWSSASHNHLASIRNLVGKRWLSDDILDNVFDLMNRTHDDTICFVCKPTWILYSSAGLHEKMHSIRSSGVTHSRVIVAINVGCDSDGAYYISDERRQGVHWAVLIIDLHCSKTYYGDSLWGLTWLASTKQFNRNGGCKLEKTGGRPWDKYYYFT